MIYNRCNTLFELNLTFICNDIVSFIIQIILSLFSSLVSFVVVIELLKKKTDYMQRTFHHSRPHSPFRFS